MTERSSSAADYLAAERTFLAWIRTGLALMGFGFVIARFALFLQALQVGQRDLPVRFNDVSPWLGAALISLGIIVNIWSMVAHVRLVQQLNSGGSEFKRTSVLAIGLAVVLAALGLAMAVYLVTIREA
jgi:putative membrane protein